MSDQNNTQPDESKFNWGEGVFSALDGFLDGIRAGKAGQPTKAAAAPEDKTTQYLLIGGGFVLVLVLIVVMLSKK
jgi:hypothetical protein